jgi:hypothetical protein
MMNLKRAATLVAAVLSTAAAAGPGPVQTVPERPAAPALTAGPALASAPRMPASDGATGLPYSAIASAIYQSQYADALNARGVRYLRLDCISRSDGAAYASVWSPTPEGRTPHSGQSDSAACKPGPVAVFKVLAPPKYLGPGASIAAYVDAHVPWSVVRTQTANFLYAVPRLDR